MSRSSLHALLFAILLSPASAQAQESGSPDSLKEIVVQAKIPKHGDFMGFGFDSLWMMSSGALIRVDPADNSFTETEIKGSFGRYRGIAIGEDAVWIPDVGADIIFKVDPQSLQVLKEIPVDMQGSEGSIGVGEGAIWVVIDADSALVRFNVESGTQEAKIALPSSGAGVVVDYGSVWVTADRADELYRIDPKANKLVSTIPVHASPRFIASGENSIWVLNQGDGSVQRIDGETGAVIATIDAGLAGGGGDITTGGGFIWVTTRRIPMVQIDPRRNSVVGKFGALAMGDAIRYGAGSVWISGPSIFRVQPPE
jgi:streptogramin lyase